MKAILSLGLFKSYDINSTPVSTCWITRFTPSGEINYEKPYSGDGTSFYAWDDERIYSDHAPCAEDLDALGADIRYPLKDSYYLSEYRYAAVTAMHCYAFLDPNSHNVMADNNIFDVYVGEDTVILAESKGYACVIFPDLGRAGWVNLDYLSCS